MYKLLSTKFYIGAFTSLLFSLSIVLPSVAVSLLDTSPPVRPGSPSRPVLPPRHDAQRQLKSATSISHSYDNIEKGGHIELQILHLALDYWAEIEWMDSNGNWHVVEGWRGSTTKGLVRWYVAPNDLGKGPFRWKVYDDEFGNLVATSVGFQLPQYRQEKVTILLDFTEHTMTLTQLR